jgi:hypothetical protein
VAGSEDEVPENCRTEFPPMGEVTGNHFGACWYPLEKGGEFQKAAHA